MFALPFHVDDRNGIDLVAGGKGPGAAIGCFESPRDPRRLAEWHWRAWRPAGRLMSLVASDMDGDLDVVFSDRKGELTGCFWLENPGPARAATEVWLEHPIGGLGREAMFLALGDIDCDGVEDVVLAARPREILLLRRLGRNGLRWESRSIPLPAEAGDSKAASMVDVDLDGRPDLVFSCEQTPPGHFGVMWLDVVRNRAHPISAEGVKFDLVALVDLDGDCDLDGITTEEVTNLGVVWFEHPAR